MGRATPEVAAPPSADKPRKDSAVERSVSGVRRMIVTGALLPGEQIRQAEMADRLQVSRVPLREALKVLQSEGVLLHRPNQGYFVAKLRAAELSQIYLMRKLIESELLRTIEWPGNDGLQEIAAHNRRLADAIERDELAEIVAHNRRFHFAIFALSPLDLLGREVDRLWSMSDTYRSVYLYDRRARERILAEHEEIISALGRHDHRAVIRLCDAHRRAVEEQLAGLVGANGSAGWRSAALGSPASD